MYLPIAWKAATNRKGNSASPFSGTPKRHLVMFSTDIQAKIILYGANKATLAQGSITAAFGYTPAANNYASFYDDSRVNWSVLFENESQV